MDWYKVERQISLLEIFPSAESLRYVARVLAWFYRKRFGIRGLSMSSLYVENKYWESYLLKGTYCSKVIAPQIA